MSPQFITIASILLSGTSLLLYNISTFKKSKHKIVGTQMCCSICDILMYSITGGKSGIANSIVNLCKNTAFAKFNNHRMTILFTSIRVILLIINYEKIFTWLFVAIEIIITVILLKGTTQQLRYSHLVSQTIWVFYDYTFANIFVALITSTSCISLIIAIIKNKKSFNKEKNRYEYI